MHLVGGNFEYWMMEYGMPGLLLDTIQISGAEIYVLCYLCLFQFMLFVSFNSYCE